MLFTKVDEIRKEMEKFDWLIDEETARLLILEKKNMMHNKKIAELIEGSATIYAKILSIGKKRNRFINIVIGDESGICILRLWKKIFWLKEGDVIKIANGWVKNGYYGKEINIGRYGNIEKINKEIKVKINFGMNGKIFNLNGKLIKKFPTKIYFYEKGEKFVRKVLLNEIEIYLYDEKAKEIEKFEEGSSLSFLFLHSKYGKIYATDFSKIIKR